jgi:translation initiation factor IF-2
MRGDDLLFDGPMASLKRFKDDVKEVAAGYECGIVLEKYNDFREDDTIEAYMMVEVPR